MHVDKLSPVYGIAHGELGDDDSGIDNIENGEEDTMMDVLMSEALKEMESQDDTEAEMPAEGVHQRPQWERGSSILVERQAILDAHERSANQSLRFTENADGEQIIATVQRPQARSQSKGNWESVLSDRTAVGDRK